MTGRWEGREYVWECDGCGSVLCSRETPAPEARRCLACQASVTVGVMQRQLVDMTKELVELRAERRRLLREKDEQLDEIHTLRDALQALQPAPESGARSA